MRLAPLLGRLSATSGGGGPSYLPRESEDSNEVMTAKCLTRELPK